MAKPNNLENILIELASEWTNTIIDTTGEGSSGLFEGMERTGSSLTEAKSAIVDLFLDLIGKDEKLNPRHLSKDHEGYDCVVCEGRRHRNDLRAELRAKAEELRR